MGTIATFVIATVLPLAATIGITMSLLESSLGYATTEELDGLSRTLEDTVRQFYQREREALRQDAAMGRSAPTMYGVVVGRNSGSSWRRTVYQSQPSNNRNAL